MSSRFSVMLSRPSVFLFEPSSRQGLDASNGGDVGAIVPAVRLLEVDGGTRWGEVGQGQALLDCLMQKLVSVSPPGLNQTAFLPAFAPHAAMR